MGGSVGGTQQGGKWILLGILPPMSPSPPRAPAPADPHRLPRTVVPDRYEIRLEPDLERLTFTGDEMVTVTMHEPVTEIVLNAAELQIQQVSTRGAAGLTLQGGA